MVKLVWRPEIGFFLVIWLGLLATGRSSLLRDPGTFWHTVVGEEILTSGEVPQTDVYSFTRHGEPWVAYQWLAECGMALVHRAAGFDGLLLATVTLLAGVYSWLAGRLMRAGLHWLPTILAIAIVLAASSYHFHVRPHLLTIAFLGLSFAWLNDVEAGRRPLYWLFALVPLHFLWANVHGGVLAGMGIVGLIFLAWTCLWLVGRESPVRSCRDLLPLSLILVGVALPMVLNPYGLELPGIWARIMLADLPLLIQEHAPLDLGETGGIAVLTLAAAYVAVLLGTLPRWPRVSWLIPLLLLYLAFGRVRHGPLFALTASLAIADMLPHCRWWTWLGRQTEMLALLPAPSVISPWRSSQLLVPVLTVLLATVLQVAGVAVPVIGANWAKHDPEQWPVELVPALRSQLQGDAQESPRVFNDMAFGAFLMYHTPQVPVFIDDRCELYVDGLLQEYDWALRENQAQIEVWRREYNLSWTLTRRGSSFDGYVRSSQNWEIVAECPAATLCRQREVSAPLRSRLVESAESDR